MDVSLEKRKNDRLLWLDIGKAAGILVVLAVHAGCDLGMLTFYGGMFYMPIFFVAAGYTYRRRERESYGAFLKKKARRLLVPYALTNVFLWLFFWLKDSVLAGNPGDLKPVSLFGILYSRNQMVTVSLLNLEHEGSVAPQVLMDLLNSPTWFLTAMFLTYAFYEGISRTKGKYLWLVLGLVASVAWHHIGPLLLPWSLDAVPYFACFFAAGEFIREKKILSAWRICALPSFLLFAILAYLNGSVNLSIGDYGRDMLVYLLVGSLGSILVFWLGMGLERLCLPAARLAAVIGQQTLVILCLHMFLYMFLQTLGNLLGFPEWAIHLLEVAGALVILTATGVLYGKFRSKSSWRR